MSPIVILLDERWIRTDKWVKIPGQRLAGKRLSAQRGPSPRRSRPET